VIRLRRFAAGPAKASKGLVDTIVEDVCGVHPFHNPKEEGAKMQSACDDMLEDMDGAMVKSLHNVLQEGGDSWPTAAPGFTDVYAKPVCVRATQMCTEEQFEGSTAIARKTEL
jgi:hypothetical protein